MKSFDFMGIFLLPHLIHSRSVAFSHQFVIIQYETYFPLTEKRSTIWNRDIKSGTASGHLMWNVGSMLDSISSFELVSFKVKELSESNSFNGSADYAMTTDLSKPLIVVELEKGKRKVIDGNHRLFKALNSGIETISAYYLTKEDSVRFIENYNEQTYHKIICELYADLDP